MKAKAPATPQAQTDAVGKPAARPRAKARTRKAKDEPAARIIPFTSVCQSASEWKSSSESADQVVCLVDEDGKVLFANNCLQRWGLIEDTELAIGLSVHALLHPGCDNPYCPFGDIHEVIADSIAGNRIEMREADDARLDRHFEYMIVPVVISRDLPGNPLSNAAILHISDLTSQRRTENWLRDSVDELSQELKRRTLALEEASERSQRTEAALRRADSELKLVSAALMTMQEIERKRIATELHDSIGQALTALSFSVSNALSAVERGDHRATRDLLEKLAPQVKETIAEVRRIAMDLRPTTLDDLGIIGTLSWFFREFRVIHPDTSLQTEIHLQESDVAPALRTTIYRVVQEAVNNALKHAQASEVGVRLWSTDCALHLVVSDNGSGFNPSSLGKHGATMGMGMKSMRDRTEFSGGEFLIESEIGKGTRITSSWPRKAAKS